MIRRCCARSAPTRSPFSALFGRAPSRLALLGIRAYQLLVSPYFGGSCRFLPSCSAYAAEAIATYGVLRGGWLSAKRLVRCHPLCAAGHDPVPQRMTRPSTGRAV